MHAPHNAFGGFSRQQKAVLVHHGPRAEPLVLQRQLQELWSGVLRRQHHRHLAAIIAVICTVLGHASSSTATVRRRVSGQQFRHP